jgi:hypothetical protein
MTTEKESLVCPFCNEGDFDKIGLKYHLINHCEEYRLTANINRP